MHARLISYSQTDQRWPTEDLGGLYNVSDLIAFCARVSNPSNQANTKTTKRLLEYLIKHKHWSPFEMASCCVEVTTTRDIARQLLRHRSFSFQEFSQRYADVSSLDKSFVTREARLQDSTNRQNSIPTDDQRLQMIWTSHQNKVLSYAKEAYEWAIENGIAKEQARVVLPEGLTVSRLYVNGTIRSWIHYLELRTANGTQKEHMDLAKVIASAIKEIYPLILDEK